MEWNGIQWNGIQWNGMEWNGMEWNGMEWNGMEWNGIKRMVSRESVVSVRVSVSYFMFCHFVLYFILFKCIEFLILGSHYILLYRMDDLRMYDNMYTSFV